MSAPRARAGCGRAGRRHDGEAATSAAILSVFISCLSSVDAVGPAFGPDGRQGRRCRRWRRGAQHDGNERSCRRGAVGDHTVLARSSGHGGRRSVDALTTMWVSAGAARARWRAVRRREQSRTASSPAAHRLVDGGEGEFTGGDVDVVEADDMVLGRANRARRPPDDAVPSRRSSRDDVGRSPSDRPGGAAPPATVAQFRLDLLVGQVVSRRQRAPVAGGRRAVMLSGSRSPAGRRLDARSRGTRDGPAR
jgi:hypothetical protein